MECALRAGKRQSGQKDAMLANMLFLPDGRGVEFSNEARGRIAPSTLEEIRYGRR